MVSVFTDYEHTTKECIEHSNAHIRRCINERIQLHDATNVKLTSNYINNDKCFFTRSALNTWFCCTSIWRRVKRSMQPQKLNEMYPSKFLFTNVWYYCCVCQNACTTKSNIKSKKLMLKTRVLWLCVLQRMVYTYTCFVRQKDIRPEKPVPQIQKVCFCAVIPAN